MPECEWGAENSCLSTYHLGGEKTEAVMKFHYHFFDNDDANGGYSSLGIFTPFARPFRQQKPPRKAEKAPAEGVVLLENSWWQLGCSQKISKNYTP